MKDNLFCILRESYYCAVSYFIFNLLFVSLRSSVTLSVLASVKMFNPICFDSKLLFYFIMSLYVPICVQSLCLLIMFFPSLILSFIASVIFRKHHLSILFYLLHQKISYLIKFHQQPENQNVLIQEAFKRYYLAIKPQIMPQMMFMIKILSTCLIMLY